MESIFKNKKENVMKIIVSFFFSLIRRREELDMFRMWERVNVKSRREILYPNMEDKKIRED